MGIPHKVLCRFLVPLCLTAVALVAFGQTASAADARRPVVVELYTSQGCSSCPPADALLARLADRKDVLALSLPITYWDMLGWKDTLATPANTKRQKAYAAAMGHGGVYTPQMIIDGVSDVVGSREQSVLDTIAARAADMQFVPVSLKLSSGELHVRIGAAAHKPAQGATIWLFSISGHARVKIGAGENGGRDMTYRNIGRDVRAIGIWKGQPVSLDLPYPALSGDEALAIIVQKGGYGRIIGAAATP
jgi:hypothetical protein